MTAERTGKSEQMYKDLGNFIFTETQSMLKKPKSLITKLKGVGNWYLRKKRMQIVTENYVEPIITEFTSEDSLRIINDRKEQYNIFMERLKDYENYLSMKKEIREKRHENQVLLESNNRKDKSD